ncbi:protein of unknown function DUF4157 [Rhizobium sp. CF080]|uniref:eCIS core domain-containing protein n=1 Tax=Rhizobium sp. (strain CF080) TaxID=1144310 RepID=UPI0002716FC7|nr:DUF4157 domain-containing protein [Rhizobium sp. CF080]EUB95885.1 protein of unknown function DUF4157 [Rhizobium sp. CF080]
MGRSFFRSFIVSAVIAIFSATAVLGGGLIGDIVNSVAPGVGTALDDVHRGIKETVPGYKQLEEGASKTVNETLVQASAPALQEAIARSRDDALRQGVQPLPPNIRQNLVGFIPDHILNIARYRVRGGGDLSLQVNAIRYGEAAAITLDYVIVFKEQNDALYNPVLWAHELTHIIQYQNWGLRDFSIRYVRSSGSVEKEAYDAEARYVAWAAVRNSQAAPAGPTNPNTFNRPLQAFANTQPSNICGASTGACQVNGFAPVGTPCWCDTFAGPAVGSLIPSQFAAAPQPAQPPGFPPGFVTVGCGCWGPMPAPIVPAGQCMSGQAALAGCPAACGFGSQAYGYVCR